MTGVTPAEGRAKLTLYCSFCGKSNHEVAKLIAGPTAFICDECVAMCLELCLSEGGEHWRQLALGIADRMKPPAPFNEAQEARILEIIGEVSSPSEIGRVG